MSELRVPIARDAAGVLVHADNATRGHHACPGCDQRVVLRAGEILRRHFGHLSDACGSETLLHKTVKLGLAQVLRLAIAGVASWPRLLVQCEAKRHWILLPRFPASRVEVEFPLASGHIADIAVLDQSGHPFVIEIAVTHRVGDEKSRALIDAGIPWIELEPSSDAIDLVLDAGTDWRAAQWYTRRSLGCKSCEESALALARREEERKRFERARVVRERAIIEQERKRIERRERQSVRERVGKMFERIGQVAELLHLLASTPMETWKIMRAYSRARMGLGYFADTSDVRKWSSRVGIRSMIGPRDVENALPMLTRLFLTRDTASRCVREMLQQYSEPQVAMTGILLLPPTQPKGMTAGESWAMWRCIEAGIPVDLITEEMGLSWDADRCLYERREFVKRSGMLIAAEETYDH